MVVKRLRNEHENMLKFADLKPVRAFQILRIPAICQVRLADVANKTRRGGCTAAGHTELLYYGEDSEGCPHLLCQHVGGPCTALAFSFVWVSPAVSLMRF
jgi:hypothetical protein